jgi:hypothetical protein
MCASTRWKRCHSSKDGYGQRRPLYILDWRLRMTERDDLELERALDLVERTVRYRNCGRQRARAVINYCRTMHLSLDDVVIELHVDPYWSVRRNRTEREKLAGCIGYTNSTLKGYPIAIYWVLPKRGLAIGPSEILLQKPNNE